MSIRHGGRQRGTPNRRTQRAVELLEEVGFDPLMAMVELALDPTNTPELRGRMASELARYVYPMLRATEHTGDVDVTVNGDNDMDELRRRLDAMRTAELEALEVVAEAMARIAQEKVAQGEMEERQAAERAALVRTNGHGVH